MPPTPPRLPTFDTRSSVMLVTGTLRIFAPPMISPPSSLAPRIPKLTALILPLIFTIAKIGISISDAVFTPTVKKLVETPSSLALPANSSISKTTRKHNVRSFIKNDSTTPITMFSREIWISPLISMSSGSLVLLHYRF